MKTLSIDEILQSQKKYFESGVTLPIDFRIKMLKRLYSAVKTHEADIVKALKSDLGKSETESFMCEIGMTLTELSHMIKHVKKYAKKHRVRTPMSQFASKSYTLASPYGNTLIMSPWNYPLLLTLEPLANAIAAGNTAIVKPSAYSPATAETVKQIICECFPPEYVAVVMGGRRENAELLDKKFDFIFFTGSQAVGKEVLRHAAESLTPAVLELGGKSPCIVDASADIPLSAKRIVFGKFLNCGQTCVAPDYILCDARIKEKLICEIKKQIILQFGEKPLENENYGKIVNAKHFERVRSLIDKQKTVFGGEFDEGTQRISPTVMDNAAWSDAVMCEEIFGPILPILTFDNFSDIIPLLQSKQKPLALYIFSQDKANISQVTQRLSFGGGCVNDVIIHLATSEMGFGGVGESGMGSYHGKAGFDAFSHTKSIVDKKLFIDLPMRYQPYTKKHLKTIRKFMN